MTRDPGWLEALLATAIRIRSVAAARHSALAGPRPAKLVAIGLATVDRERAASAADAGEWTALPRDPLLGATVHRLVDDAGLAGDVAVLLLEPDTEGPLAASLARYGEGLAAIYVRSPRLPPEARAAGTGPLGPARLLPGPRWGPHVVAVERVSGRDSSLRLRRAGPLPESAATSARGGRHRRGAVGRPTAPVG